jgi:transcriptional regulator with XRE-family HTH domain
MKKLAEFASGLRAAQQQQRKSATALAAATGLSPLAVRQMLAGNAAPRLTNAMAVADALGLELVLVPKAVAAGLSSADDTPQRSVLTDIERRLQQAK